MPEPRYRINTVQEAPLPDPTGRISYVTRVTYTLLANQYVGTITIDKRQATPDEVKTAVEADVARVEQIFSLGG